MKERFLILIVITLFSFQIQAQSSFSIKITQTYPAGGVVYGNMYKLSGELDKAEQQLRSQYSGKSANYIMELTRPSGKETKYIQNIEWILSENGKKTNFKSKPILKEYYNESTVVEYYACDINGRPKSNSEKLEYKYYYSFFKGNGIFPFYKGTETVRTLADCRKKAEEYFTANKVDTVLCIAKIYDASTWSIVDSSNSNRTAYMQHLTALDALKTQTQKRIADSIQAAKIAEMKKQEELEKLKTDSIEKANSNVYDEERIEKRLKLLQRKAETLQKGSNLLSDMNLIINEAKMHAKALGADSTVDKYFGTADLNDLKTGLEKLLDINRKKAEKVKKAEKAKEQSEKAKNKKK